MQRPEFISSPNRFLCLPRLSEYNFRSVIDERIQPGIQALDAIKVSPRHLHRRNLFAADLSRNFPRRKKMRV